MNFKECLKHYGFNNIFEELLSIYPNEHDKKKLYKKAFNELISLKGKTDKKIEHIDIHGDYDEEGFVYFIVRLKNKFYVPPPSGYKAYGGKMNDEGDVPPNGNFFNINCDRYNQFFAIGPNWDEYVSLPINSIYPDITATAATLYEITFHGFSQKQCKDFFKNLTDKWHTHQ